MNKGILLLGLLLLALFCLSKKRILTGGTDDLKNVSGLKVPNLDNDDINDIDNDDNDDLDDLDNDDIDDIDDIDSKTTTEKKNVVVATKPPTKEDPNILKMLKKISNLKKENERLRQEHKKQKYNMYTKMYTDMDSNTDNFITKDEFDTYYKLK